MISQLGSQPLKIFGWDMSRWTQHTPFTPWWRLGTGGSTYLFQFMEMKDGGRTKPLFLSNPFAQSSATRGQPTPTWVGILTKYSSYMSFQLGHSSRNPNKMNHLNLKFILDHPGPILDLSLGRVKAYFYNEIHVHRYGQHILHQEQLGCLASWDGWRSQCVVHLRIASQHSSRNRVRACGSGGREGRLALCEEGIWSHHWVHLQANLSYVLEWCSLVWKYHIWSDTICAVSIWIPY